MQNFKQFAATLLLLFCSSIWLSPVFAATNDCPIEQRKSQIIGQSNAKKVQRSFSAYQAGNLNEAIAILLEANPKKPFEKAYVARMLGNFFAEKGQVSKALNYLKQAVDADVLAGNDHSATLRLYADLLLQNKQFSEAIYQYQAWMRFTCQEDPAVYRRIGIAYSQQKQWDQVIQVANKGIALANEPDKGLYQMKLTAFYNKKQYQNAINVLEEMLPLFADDKRLWIQLAQFYLLVENYDKALVTYDLAYRNNFLETPANVIRLTQLMAAKGAPYQGAKIFAANLKSGLLDTNKKNLKQLASFYHQAKELDQAAYYYGQAAAIDNDGELYLKQGRILSVAQNYQAAISAFKQSLTAKLEHPGEANFELALAYLGLKQYQAAYQYAKLAKNDSKTAKSATNYLSYIQEKARIHNIVL